MALTDKVAFTTVAIMEGELGIAVGSATTVLERQILAASAAIERYCNRAFRKLAVTERLYGSGSRRLVVPRTPIVGTITSITDDGATVDATTYRVEDANAGIIVGDALWHRPPEHVVEGSVGQEPVNGTGEWLFVVSYTGGYVLPGDSSGTRNLPEEIEEACIATVASLYRRRGNDGTIASEALGDYSVGYGGLNTAIGRGLGGIITDAYMAILDRYRRPVMV